MLAAKRKVLLYSGGLDSFCMYHLLEFQGVGFTAVNLPVDTPSYVEEQQRVDFHKRKLAMNIQTSDSILNIRKYTYPDGFVPLRNLLFVALPVMAGADIVLLGAVKGEWSRDKSKKFFKDTSSLFSYLLDRDILIDAPFQDRTKLQLVRETLDTGLVTPENLETTFSCYAGPMNTGIAGCGECNACFRRWVAMAGNGIEEEYRIKNMAEYWDKKVKQEKFSKIKETLTEQSPRRWPALYANNSEALRVIKGELKKSPLKN